MEVKSLLQIGVGRTGNVLLNEMMNLDGRYVGLFINSAKKDMYDLKNCQKENSFNIPQVDGTGRNRDKAKEYIMRWKESFFDLLYKYSEYDTLSFYFSFDGGTGSGCVPTLINLAKNMFKQNFNKDINIIAIGVLPKTTVSSNGLNNTKACWNDIIKLATNHIDSEGNEKIGEDGSEMKPTINTLYLIDNNKRDTYEEINTEAVNCLNIAYNFDSYDVGGDIDTNDSNNINISNGYNLILPLSNKYNDVASAIVDSQERSIFSLPTGANYASRYLGILTSPDLYNADDILSITDRASEDTYVAISEEENVIFFGGLSIPKSAIENISTELDNRKNDGKSHAENLFVKIEKEKTTNKSSNTETKTTNISPKKRKNLINDDLFKF
jgi:hypothetical protein